jgi:protoporphyrinogen oxidase
MGEKIIMKIGIIGGGLMGLATAYYLNKRGHKVTILEKEKEIGGLSGSEEISPGFRWDRFYHVILTTDSALLEFLDELGLSEDIKFRETKTGFYTDGQFHSMSTTMEFLKFKPLSLIDKLRLGAGILYASRIKNWKRLEKKTAKAWLIRVFGRRNYEKMWEPLLRAKLGAAREKISAAFIWSTIRRYYGTRQNSSKKEMMGCAETGYNYILNRLNDYLVSHGTTIYEGYRAKCIEPINGKRIAIKSDNGISFVFDRVIATTPTPTIHNLYSDFADEFRFKLENIKYLGIVCATLLLKKSLTPFYVTNLTDNGLPFTGLIEVTNVMPQAILNGNSLVYLPKYVPVEDPFFKKPDEEISREFIGALKKMFPELNDEDILACKINREPYVQPIQGIGYSEKIPSMQATVNNFYMVNTAMIQNSNVNNNEVIKLARQAADFVGGT